MTTAMIPEETSFHDNPGNDMRRPGERIVLDDDDDSDESQDDDDFDPSTPKNNLSVRTKSKKNRKSSLGGGNGPGGVPPSSAKRRRRRSSARFLKLGDTEGDDENSPNGSQPTSLDNLGEVYQKAIRMNAENRINAANSWNLNLIDHLDRFVAPELRTKTSLTMEDTLSAATGVNFTKASCTLDASVKIYSYRVDDVHLTSYKVLANLNRTDTKEDGGKKSKKQSDEGNALEESSQSQRKGNAAGNVDTLEHNLSNINIHKLDAAFDIDPLFHKMSKTFDEGGAKGLLLANLAVGSGGCKIIFDSSLDDVEDNDCTAQEDNNVGSDESTPVDVTTLTTKLSSLVAASGQSIEDLPLVPQLASLRHEFATLQKDGFVDNQVIATNRYASSHQDELEADRSIHVEAIERSRASQADLGRSLMAQDDSKASAGHCSREILGFGGVGDFDEPDDFGAGGDFAGDDDEYGSFHDGDHRFSSASFQAIPSFDPETGRVSSGSTKASQHRLMPKPSFSQATVLLDAIASGDISTSQPNNPYEYFNSQALANLSTGNLWAGADHWKKMSKPRKAVKSGTKTGNDDAASSAKMPVKKKKTRKGKTAASTNGHGTLVDITKPIENLKELLEKPKKTKKSTISKLQWTQAMQTKHNNEDNLLPMDAGLGVKELTTLFLRPTANLADMMNDTILRYGNVGTSNAPKVVGFGGVETWGGDDFGDDDGYGFDIGGGDEVEPEDFVVPDLEGVRKVEKIKVGYATVAKKVDVKRLKLDLWEELERTFQRREESNNSIPTDVDPLDLEITAAELNDRVGQVDSATVSFQQTVRDMQATQAQTDVTLPFYFICVLHLCNEKGMTLESSGLNDFLIYSP